MRHFIHTNTGARYFYDGGAGTEVTIEDVAHHICNVARFGGATDHHYSVGYHSLLVEHILNQWNAEPRLRLRGLLHDAHEGFMGGDFPTPFQEWFREEICGGIDYLEQAKTYCDKVIFDGLGVNYQLCPAEQATLSIADKTAFIIEAGQVFREPPNWLEEYKERFKLRHFPDYVIILPADNAYIKRKFLAKYDELYDMVFDKTENAA